MVDMFSRNPEQSKGISFYRLMSLVGILVSVFFSCIFLWVFPGEELIWDRVLVFCASVFCYLISYKKSLSRKRIYLAVNGLFYLFTAQIILSNVLNGFEFVYLVSLFVTLQAISISFRDEKQSAWYLGYSAFLTSLGVLLMENQDFSQGVFIIATISISSLLLFVIVRIKSKFHRSIKVHEELLRTIVSKTEDALFLTDFEGLIHETNERALEMFGYTKEEMHRMDFAWLRKEQLSEDEDALGVVQLIENKFWNSEVELVGKDGHCFVGYVSIGMIKKFSDEYLVYRVKDVTSRKEAEQQLIEAKDQAEAADHAKSLFLATMSHEIRTPMNGVIGMTNLLSITDLNGEQKGFVETIKKSGENLIVIINDILDFSKIESGKVELEKVVYDLHDMLYDVVDLLSQTAEGKKLSLALKIGADVPRKVVGDAVRLKQILVNLVNNAIKFTDTGSVHVFVDLPQDGDKKSLHFRVEDTGIGIPDEKLHRLFQSFSQVDSSTTRKYGGTGLGLAICKNLVEIMGGKISVSSSENQGSVFSFDIAFPDEVSAEFQERPIEIHLDNKLEAFNLEELKVLVAEDNIVNQQVAMLILKNIGINADIVSNGLRAIEALDAEHYDLVFMDLQMPEMDGMTATREILKSRKDAWIIAMTANAMKEDRDACLEVGMKGFVSKPIVVAEIKEQILNFLKDAHIDTKSDANSNDSSIK